MSSAWSGTKTGSSLPPIRSSSRRRPTGGRRTRSASLSTSAPSHSPFINVQALMQQSTSPPQYGRSSYSQRLFAARRSGRVREDRRIQPPLAQRVQRPGRRCPRLTGSLRRLRALEVEARRERTPRRPTGHPGPADRGAWRRTPPSRRELGSPPRLPPGRRRGRARPASAVPGRSQGASRSGREYDWQEGSDGSKRQGSARVPASVRMSRGPSRRPQPDAPSRAAYRPARDVPSVVQRRRRDDARARP